MAPVSFASHHVTHICYEKVDLFCIFKAGLKTAKGIQCGLKEKNTVTERLIAISYLIK